MQLNCAMPLNEFDLKSYELHMIPDKSSLAAYNRTQKLKHIFTCLKANKYISLSLHLNDPVLCYIELLPVSLRVLPDIKPLAEYWLMPNKSPNLVLVKAQELATTKTIVAHESSEHHDKCQFGYQLQYCFTKFNRKEVAAEYSSWIIVQRSMLDNITS